MIQEPYRNSTPPSHNRNAITNANANRQGGKGGGGRRQPPCLKSSADMNPTRPRPPSENYLPAYGT